jgi:hypothetical protein
MSRALESFDDLSLKVVAVRTVEDSDFAFEFPAPGPQSAPSVLTRLEQPAEVHRDSPAQIHLWHHAGIHNLTFGHFSRAPLKKGALRAKVIKNAHQ